MAHPVLVQRRPQIRLQIDAPTQDKEKSPISSLITMNMGLRFQSFQIPPLGGALFKTGGCSGSPLYI